METLQCTWHAHFRHLYLGTINHFSSLKNNFSSASLALVSLVVPACYKHVLSVQLCICCDDEFMLLPTIHVGSQSFDKSNTVCCVFLQNAQVFTRPIWAPPPESSSIECVVMYGCRWCIVLLLPWCSVLVVLYSVYSPATEAISIL